MVLIYDPYLHPCIYPYSSPYLHPYNGVIYSPYLYPYPYSKCGV